MAPLIAAEAQVNCFTKAELASKYAPGAYRFYLDVQRQRQRKRVARLLSAPGPPEFLPDIEFDRLMARRFLRAGAYEYDIFSSTARAASRIQQLAKQFPMLTRPCRILEVSCGDGLVGSLLAMGGHHVTLADVRDWRQELARGLDFTTWDVCGPLAFETERFDLIVAYNAAEHWADPGAALNNLLSLCRPGGFVLLDFGPLFNSPWGLHAWSVAFPYPQFLFSRELVDARVSEMGVDDLGQGGAVLQPTNGWSLNQFRGAWGQSGAKIISNFEDRDWRYLGLVEEFSACFAGRGLSLEDLTVNSIAIVLQKA